MGHPSFQIRYDMQISDKELMDKARHVTDKVRQMANLRDDWKLMGCVGAALVTSQDNIYTGVNIHLLCGMGICAEYSAVADMIKNGETHIRKIVSITSTGNVLPPCGRCREMLYQINVLNLQTKVLIADNETKLLQELLPFNWQNNFDRSLYG